jgi:hypothetical protein
VRTVQISSLTLASMLVLNWLLALVLHLHFIDISCLIGFVFIAFTRTTSFTSQEKSELTYNDYQLQEKTGLNVIRDKRTFLPSVPFYTALLYALISLVLLLIVYWHAFFN